MWRHLLYAHDFTNLIKGNYLITYSSLILCRNRLSHKPNLYTLNLHHLISSGECITAIWMKFTGNFLFKFYYICSIVILKKFIIFCMDLLLTPTLIYWLYSAGSLKVLPGIEESRCWFGFNSPPKPHPYSHCRQHHQQHYDSSISCSMFNLQYILVDQGFFSP